MGVTSTFNRFNEVKVRTESCISIITATDINPSVHCCCFFIRPSSRSVSMIVSLTGKRESRGDIFMRSVHVLLTCSQCYYPAAHPCSRSCTVSNRGAKILKTPSKKVLWYVQDSERFDTVCDRGEPCNNCTHYTEWLCLQVWLASNVHVFQEKCHKSEVKRAVPSWLGQWLRILHHEECEWLVQYSPMLILIKAFGLHHILVNT